MSAPLLTYPSRMLVDAVNPDPATLRIEDIAHSLAREGRFANFTAEPWTVAAHSIVVARLCERDPEADHQDPLRGLLHDADEAYLRDLPGPVKHDPRLAGYREVQHAFSAVIAEHYGVGWLDGPVVKRADETALIMEEVMIRHEATQRARCFDPAVKLLMEELMLMHSASVRVRFLQEFERLVDKARGAPLRGHLSAHAGAQPRGRVMLGLEESE